MIAFRAHKNGSAQGGFPTNMYSQVTFPVVVPDTAYNAAGYEHGGRYASSAWTPVINGESPAPVQFSGQIWVPNGIGIAGGENYTARIVKNGWQFGRPLGAKMSAKGTFVGDWVIDLSMQDIAEPGDVYTVWLHTTNPNSHVDGNALHTWWSGIKLG